MRAAPVSTRVALILAVVGLALFIGGPQRISSQPSEEGGFQSYVLPGESPGGAPLSPSGLGHVVGQAVFRDPPVAGLMAVADKIVFTKDEAGGLAIAVTGAEDHDKWTWSYYFPGNPPGGGVPDKSCWAEIWAPGIRMPSLT